MTFSFQMENINFKSNLVAKIEKIIAKIEEKRFYNVKF